VADASPLPVLLYLHHDRWPDDSFSLSEVSKVIGPLAEHPNIVGVKDAAKDFRDHLRLIVQTRHLDFSVLTSAGRFLNANLSAGGAGGAFHEAVVAPRLYARLQEATRQGAAAALPALLDLASELGDVLGSQDPASAKAACSLMGLCRPDMIPPLKQGTAALMDRLAPLLSKLSDAGFGKLVN
jgi:4-hydroxy-tetrahydrodipicolinate synthase